jgi:diacylglycerol kinase (ATP)
VLAQADESDDSDMRKRTLKGRHVHIIPKYLVSRVRASCPHFVKEPVDVIVNERARHLGLGSRLHEAIARTARSSGAIVHFTRDLDALSAATREIASRGTSCVVIAGGDGSHMAATTALADAFGGALPPVAIAPGGTVCTLARAWGFSGFHSQERYILQLIETLAIGRGRAKTRPSLLVCDATGARRIGFIFGTGLIARFFDIYEQQPIKGNATATRLAGEIFAGSMFGSALAKGVLAPTPCKLVVDGIMKKPRAYSLIASSVLRDLGLHMRLTYRAPASSDRLHVVASSLPPFALGPQLPRVLAGKELRGRDHVDELACGFEVRFTGEMRTYVLDGDAFTASDVRVSPGPPLIVLGL